MKTSSNGSLNQRVKPSSLSTAVSDFHCRAVWSSVEVVKPVVVPSIVSNHIANRGDHTYLSTEMHNGRLKDF